MAKEKELFFLTLRDSNDDLHEVEAAVAAKFPRYFGRVHYNVSHGRLIGLTPKEYKAAEKLILLLAQKEYFLPDVWSRLKNKAPLGPPLDQFNPEIKNDLICKKGRVAHLYPEPIPIVPRCHLGKILLADAHKATLCGTDAEVMSHWAPKYEILNKAVFTKQVRNQCSICTRYAAIPAEQQMGMAPPHKTNMHYPFSCVIIDHAGPFWIRTSNASHSKKYKAWIVVFVCPVTKAVHLELVGDCSANSFLTAFLRFCAVHGRPFLVISDNGAYYKFAAKEIHSL